MVVLVTNDKVTECLLSESKSVSPPTSNHSMVLRSSCKLKNCNAGDLCTEHDVQHQHSIKQLHASLDKSPARTVAKSLSSEREFSFVETVKKSSRHISSVFKKSVQVSSEKNTLQDSYESWKEHLLGFRLNDFRFSSAQSKQSEVLTAHAEKSLKSVRTNDRETQTEFNTNSHTSSPVTTRRPMARVLFKRDNHSRSFVQERNRNNLDEVANLPSSSLHERVLSSTTKSQDHTFVSSTRRHSEHAQRFNFENNENNNVESYQLKQAAVENKAYLSEEKESVHSHSSSESSHISQNYEGLSLYLLLLRRKMYFLLSKPTHYDLENLSRIARFGKKKALFLMLLPLLLWMLAGAILPKDYALNLSSTSSPLQSSDKIQHSSSWSILSLFSFMSRENSQKDVLVEPSKHCDTSFLPSWWVFPSSFISNFVPKEHCTKTSPPENVLPELEEHISSFETSSSVTSQMTKEEIKALIHQLLKEEMANQNLEQTRKENVWANDEINRIKREMSALNSTYQSLAANIESIEAMNANNKSSEDLEKVIKQLAVESDRIKKYLKHLEKNFVTSDMLLNSAKNCCQNETDISSIESHLTSILLRVMAEDENKVQPNLKPLQDLLSIKISGGQKLSKEVKNLADEMKAFNESLRATVIQMVKQYAETVRRELIVDTSKVADTLEKSGLLSAADVQAMVKEAILLYDADKTGQTDYALESGGGSVVNTRCSETYSERSPRLSILGIPLWYGSSSPRSAIQPDMHPGQCWAFKGSQGYLVIQLATTIRPNAFVMEHIPKSLSPTGNIDSAPKDFSVWGLISEKDNEGKLLGKYIYDKDGDPLQYFPVQETDVDVYPYVELKIHSNHGEMTYTCLYRFRVHGTRY